MEGILRELSALYHLQPMGLFERSNQTIQDVLNEMGLKDEEWDLYLPLAQYFYNTIPGPMFQGTFVMKYFMDSVLLSLRDEGKCC